MEIYVEKLIMVYYFSFAIHMKYDEKSHFAFITLSTIYRLCRDYRCMTLLDKLRKFHLN